MPAAISMVRSALAGISPRERRLIVALTSVFGALLLFGVYFWSSSALDDIEADRAATLDALRTIRNERPRIRERGAAHSRMLARYATRAEALTSFVESAARDPNAPATPPGTPASTPPPAPSTTGPSVAAGPAASSASGSASHDGSVTVAEATDQTSPTVEGRRFQRRAVAIRLRQVNLQNLVNFMDRVEAASFPVAISGLRIRRRYGESNSYDVDDMMIATWDRTGPAPGERPRSGSSSESTTGTTRPSADETSPGSRR